MNILIVLVRYSTIQTSRDRLFLCDLGSRDYLRDGPPWYPDRRQTEYHSNQGQRNHDQDISTVGLKEHGSVNLMWSHQSCLPLQFSDYRGRHHHIRRPFCYCLCLS